MNRFLIGICIGLIFSGTAWAEESELALAAVPKQLNEYYTQRGKVPPYKKALEQLASPEIQQQQQASEYLRALLAQSLADDEAGAAQWDTGYWSINYPSAARWLRERIVHYLAFENEPPPGALPVLRWYLDAEVMHTFQDAAMSVLAKLKTKEANALRLHLVSQPQHNAAVVVAALQQLQADKVKIPADKLLALCQDHRLKVREAARAINKELGGHDPGPFDAVKALRTPEIKKLMHDLGALVIENTPKEKFDDKVPQLLKEGNNGLHSGPSETLYETFSALQLYNSGKEEPAARLLFHALGMLDRDSDLLNLVRQYLGRNYGYQMLTAFAGDRDYARTEKLAALITEHYPKTIFSDYAARLADELPKRHDDFHNFKLPTPEEWTRLKAKMSRDEQIDYLSQHIRLLNCFQQSQPGGADFRHKQYAEPCGISPDATWGQNRCKTEVINPYVELVGSGQTIGALGLGNALTNNLKSIFQARGMELTLSDIPHLSKYLRDDQLLPTVSFFRDFAPGRHLESTRPLFAKIINDLAGGDICQIDTWDKLTLTQIDKEVERINLWISQNAGKPAAQLADKALDADIEKGAAWTLIQDRVELLLQQKQAKAYDIMEHYRTDNKSSWYDKYTILSFYLKYDPAKAKDIAPQYLQDTDDMVRLAAGMIVFKTGDKAAARSAIGESLAHGWVNDSTVEAVDLLLNDGTPESRAEVARLFTNKRADFDAYNGAGFYLFQLLKRCLSAGMIEPYQYSIRQLESKVVASRSLDATGKILHVNTEAEMFAKAFIDNVAPNDPGIQKIVQDFPKDEDKIAPLKQWLQLKLNAF